MVREFQNSVSGNNCRGDIHTALAGMSISVAAVRCPAAVSTKSRTVVNQIPFFSVDVIFVNTVTADDSTIGAVVFVFVPEDKKIWPCENLQ